MRATNLFFKTYKEVPADAEIKSHKLMLKAGLIKQISSGIYSYNPMGYKILKNVESVIREEMNKINGQEMLMPALVPEEIYKARLEKFGNDMFKLKDRTGKRMSLTPTHEELFALTAKDYINSYKDMPIMLYQIQTKYRDEVRPRFGVQRTKEFIMKDAYTFDSSKENLEKAYDSIRIAYKNIFKRLGLDFVIVSADTGAMGGLKSEEFMVKNESGEDSVIYCNNCGYSANTELARSIPNYNQNQEKELKLEKVETGDLKTVKDVSEFFNISSSKLVKTLVYKVDDKIVPILIKGNREVVDSKIENYFSANSIRMANKEEIYKEFNCEPGYVGPYNIKKKFYVDNELGKGTNYIIGANEEGFHYKNFQINSIENIEFSDFSLVTKDDKCINCQSKLNEMRGIEVGHIFQLGTNYSKTFKLSFVDDDSKYKDVFMGSYGIGVGRLLSSVIEQHASYDNGIIWPIDIEPFRAAIVPVSEQYIAAAERLYGKLNKDQVLLDDRKKISFGFKMNDIELIGVSKVIIVGRNAEQEEYEFLDRSKKSRTQITELDIEKIIKDS